MRKWQPYGNPRDPGALISITNLYPTESGTYRPGPTFTAKGTAAAGPATPGTTYAAWCGLKVDGTGVGYVGTSTKLYEISTLSTGSFTDRSKGGGYSGSSWCFAQFGNISIATNLDDAVQSRDATGSSAFADLAGTPPKAKIVVTQSNCVLLFNTNGGTAYQDGYATSDVGDHTNWTTGEAVSGRILTRPGPITAAVAVRDEVIVFKRNSIFRMKYEGAPLFWSVTLLADGIGTSRPSMVASCGDFIFFMGDAGAFIYDGATFRPMSEGFDNLGTFVLPAYATGRGQSALFLQNSGHVIFEPPLSGTGGTTTTALVYNIASNKFGLISVGVDKYGYALLVGDPRAVEQIATYYSFGGHSATSNAVNLINLSDNPCVICDDGGVTQTWSATFQLFGDETGVTNLTRTIPIWTATSGHTYTLPAAGSFTSTVTTYTSGAKNGSATAISNAPSSTALHRFDYNFSARFFDVSISGSSDMELDDVLFMVKQAGRD